MPDMTYAEAVNAALRHALATDDTVLLYGEDVAKPGGVHGVTRGLHREFGDRVFDTPISESAILGSAIGAAMFGRRPVVEIMWADFLFVAFDQIINQASNVRYVSRGRLTAPITIRTQQGVAPGACAQHSQNVEALLTHVPGIRVAMPANPQDAYDLMLSAIFCDDPTVVIDNRTLYRVKGEVATDRPPAPIGGSRVVHGGNDVTVVSWGRMVGQAELAARQLAGEGIGTEVLDLRWLNPLDEEGILSSLQRTRRLLVVHEATTTGGLGAEILARAAQSGIGLAAPPQRLGSLDVRMPAARRLIADAVPGADQIAQAVRRLVHPG